MERALIAARWTDQCGTGGAALTGQKPNGAKTVGGHLRRPLLDTGQAGAYTGLGERYIRRLRAERRIPCVRIGGRLLFDPDDLDRLIDEHREPAIEGPSR